MQVEIKEIKKLLEENKKIKVKSKNGEYVYIKKYIEKGLLDTWQVILKNNYKQNVAKKHQFFTNSGWVKTLELIPNETKILCDDDNYHLVKAVNYIGKYKIVDIVIDEKNYDDQCYFGNGMLNHNTAKSLLVHHILLETQKKNGVPVLIDTEHSADREFMKAIGLDLGKMIYAPIPVIEDAFQTIENIIESVRKANSDRLVTIALDSIMGATNKVEDEGTYDKQGFATQKATILSQAMRKIGKVIANHKIALIFTNQLRSNIGVTFGDPYTTSGGKAIQFHASLRLRLKNISKLKSGTDIIGIRGNCKVIKSKLGPSFRSCDYDVYFDRGLDNSTTWFETGQKYGSIIKAKKLEDETKSENKDNKFKEVKGWYMIENDLEMTRFQNPNFEELIINNPQKKQLLYDNLADKIIMKYVDRNSENIDKSKIEIDETVED